MIGLFERFKRQYTATLDRLPDFGGHLHVARILTTSTAQADGGVAAVNLKRASANNISPVVVVGHSGDTAALETSSLPH
jgi:hypothetical protein